MDDKLLEWFESNDRNKKLLEWFDSDKQNQQLLKLYEKHYEAVNKINSLNKDLSLLLSCVPENYQKMKHKILVIGQELDGGHSIKKDAKTAMLDTLKSQTSLGLNHRAFHIFSFGFCQLINDECKPKRKEDERSYYAWTNIRKFCYNKDKGKSPKGKLDDKIQNIIDEEFNILEEEIKIINPDIVLFLTGPNRPTKGDIKYDDYIKKQLKGIKFNKIENSKYEKRQFARLEHRSLPYNSFRTYHPRYLKGRISLKELKKECNL